MPAGAAVGQVGQGKGRAADINLPPCTCRRSTEATSRSTSSGALSRSPRSRARARSPSGPSSPRAVARTLASTTITIGAQRRYRRLQRNRTARAAARPVKNLLKGRFAGFLDEPGPQVLLEGLVRGGCALPQDSMSLLGHIFDLHARHGAIMALEAPVRKRAVIGEANVGHTLGKVRGGPPDHSFRRGPSASEATSLPNTSAVHGRRNEARSRRRPRMTTSLHRRCRPRTAWCRSARPSSAVSQGPGTSVTRAQADSGHFPCHA